MVRRHPVKRAAATLALALVLGAAPRARAGEELVLVASASSPVEQLDSSRVRKLFLGFAVNDHGVRLRPLLNESDPLIGQLFLQNIVAMSASTYDRYLLRLSLLHGQSRPSVYHERAQLLAAIASNPDVVGYAWARDVVHDPRLKILRVLWHD